MRFAILGFFRGNPDTQFVLTGAHCLKLELNGIERDGQQVSLLFRCKEVPFFVQRPVCRVLGRELSGKRLPQLITYLTE